MTFLMTLDSDLDDFGLRWMTVWMALYGVLDGVLADG